MRGRVSMDLKGEEGHVTLNLSLSEEEYKSDDQMTYLTTTRERIGSPVACSLRFTSSSSHSQALSVLRVEVFLMNVLKRMRYITIFKNVLFGRRARQVVLNVYARLRLEHPKASYRDIVKQTTYLTGIPHATIFRWKKIDDPYGSGKPPPVKRKRRKKDPSANPENGVKKAPKAKRQKKAAASDQPDGQGTANPGAPKKVQRRKKAAATGQPGEPGAPNPGPKKAPRKKMVRLDNQTNQPVPGPGGQPIQANKVQRKKPVRWEQPPTHVAPQSFEPVHYQPRQFARLEQQISQATAQSIDPVHCQRRPFVRMDHQPDPVNSGPPHDPGSSGGYESWTKLACDYIQLVYLDVTTKNSL
ncbi:hypothetical protein IscW_ISCW002514 [Ixodes scapularis]|uniref:Uncharacterized protein n=1 Tax=Ixodes scapularis TaxID=6945 RepID=B7P7W1_IXOSC|nr:hypothetical protein IscW_ISCW002514 [Ixodes scapularis]|eukprot:XP_002399885.1 hypothetical protein IscW_ISCW002514 [Ixodes scapularis]